MKIFIIISFLIIISPIKVFMKILRVYLSLLTKQIDILRKCIVKRNNLYNYAYRPLILMKKI